MTQQDSIRQGRLAGKVMFVTGATSGIGAAAAIEFAAAGAAVVLTGRREAKGREVAESIRSRGGVAHFIPMDVRSELAVADAVAETVRTFGRLDFAFNNAGMNGVPARVAQQTERCWDDLLEVNVKSVWRCMKHEIPAILAGGGGAIVNNSSIFGLVGSEIGVSPYVASKHAVIGLTRAAALEYASNGLRVNAVCPGFTWSEMISPDPAVQTRMSGVINANVPMKRIADASEVGRTVLWLCSDDATFVTGQAIAVDGGWTAR